MKKLQGKRALVIGATGWFGEGITKTLHAAGAEVWATGRNEGKLTALSQLEGVHPLSMEATDPRAPSLLYDQCDPSIVVLALGATPHMAPVHEQTWEQFSRVWEIDTRATFEFGREALRRPLQEGARFVVFSSGAARGGSPLSGGYSAAKRMQWLLADYLQTEARRMEHDLRFHAVLPLQIVGASGLGKVASSAYAGRAGISQEAFLERFGEMLTPDVIGAHIRDLVLGEEERLAFGLTPQGLSPVSL